MPYVSRPFLSHARSITDIVNAFSRERRGRPERADITV